MNGFTLWGLSLIIGDGFIYTFDSLGKFISAFNIGMLSSIEDLDGYGARIVNKFERVTAENETYFKIILSDETDENEHGQILLFAND